VGAVYYNAGHYDLALEQFKKTLELDPSASGVHGHLGMVYEQLGRYSEAIAEFQPAANSTTNSAFNLLMSMRFSGERAKAKQILEGLNQERI